MISCKECNTVNTSYDDNIYRCKNCGQVFFLNKNNFKYYTKNVSNKQTHFKNVIDRFYNKELTRSEKNDVDKIKSIIKKNDIDTDFVDLSFITDILQKKDYIRNYVILTKIKKDEMNLNNETINNIYIIFCKYINFLYNLNLQKTTISYQFLLYNIFDVLNIKTNLKPNIKNNKDDKKYIWNKFVIYICQNYLHVDNTNSSIVFKPRLKIDV